MIRYVNHDVIESTAAFIESPSQRHIYHNIKELSSIVVFNFHDTLSLRKQPSFFAPGAKRHWLGLGAKKDGCFRRLWYTESALKLTKKPWHLQISINQNIVYLVKTPLLNCLSLSKCIMGTGKSGAFTLPWMSILSRGNRSTPIRFMLQK